MLNTRRLGRAAFTLTELLVSVALLGLVVAGLLGVLNKQQRFYSGAAELLETRGSLRQAMDIVPADLRALAPSQGDIYAISPSAIEFRATTGAAIVCTIAIGRRTVVVPPAVLVARTGATSWPVAPQAGDSLWLFDPGTLPSPKDDRWRVYALTAALSAGICPTSTGFTTVTGEQTRGVALALSDSLPTTVPVGAAIRFFRRARYELYQPTDANWYLGYYDCLSTRGTPCGALQAVSGPYLPATTTPPGLSFTYRDSSGAVTGDPTKVTRIDLVTRAQTRGPLRMDGRPNAPYQDSLAITIRVRN